MILVYGDGTLARTDFWGYTVRRSVPLLAAWKLGVPYGIYAHSFDSFGAADGPGQPYFRRLLEDARFVFCRDGSSVEYVRELGIDAPHLMFVPDSTVSMDRRDDGWAEGFMNRHGLESREFLVVIPRTWRGGGMISPSIGRERSLSHMEKLRQIIRHWVQRTGMKVVIAAEVGRDLPNAREFVYDRLPDDLRTKCVCLDDHWITEEAIALYRHARIVLTMEMHSFLMAIPQGTPAVVATFKESGRKIRMVEDFKLPDWLFDIDQVSAEELGQAIGHIHDDYPQQSDPLEADVIPHLRRLEQRAVEIIGESLAAGAG
jgi:polysaccharide pyruvyl transferase WcaK-like protein